MTEVTMLEPKQSKLLDQINALQDKISGMTYHYWKTYSNLNTWQFWFLLMLLILPLIVLYVVLDRKRALLIGFYGLNAHIWFHYIDAFGVTHAYWAYPYKVFPFLSVSIALDTALIPVLYMLLYQWTTAQHKNYYLYGLGLCVFLSFLLKPALVTFGLFALYRGMNYFYLFLLYVIILLISKWITNIFVHFQKEQESRAAKEQSLNRFFQSKEKAK